MESLQNSLDRVQINFVERGQGIPVILIHGMAASLHDWKSMLPDLELAGYHSYALDLPGHGESAKPQDVRYYHTEAIYQQLEDWIFRLKLNQPAYLVGHSLGGYFSLEFARRNLPHVLGIALIDPLYTLDQLSALLRHLIWRTDWSEKIWRQIPEWMVNIWVQLDHSQATRFPDDDRQQIAADFKKSSPQIVHTVDGIVDLTPYLYEITVPCLVIWGERDIILNPSYYPQLVSALPQAQGMGLPGCGHQPHIEQAPKVNSIVRDFFDQLRRPELATSILEPPKAGG